MIQYAFLNKGVLVKKIILNLVILVCLSITTYANNKSRKEDSIVINLAGKERMLTQKMSKEALLIARGIDIQENKKNLKETIALFNKTLNGLYNGDKELGLG